MYKKTKVIQKLSDKIYVTINSEVSMNAKIKTRLETELKKAIKQKEDQYAEDIQFVLDYINGELSVSTLEYSGVASIEDAVAWVGLDSLVTV